MNQIMHTGRSFHRKPCRASISGAISPLLIEFLRLRNGSQRFLVVVPFGGPAVDVGALHLAPIAGALRVFDKRRGDVVLPLLIRNGEAAYLGLAVGSVGASDLGQRIIRLELIAIECGERYGEAISWERIFLASSSVTIHLMKSSVACLSLSEAFLFTAQLASYTPAGPLSSSPLMPM